MSTIPSFNQAHISDHTFQVLTLAENNSKNVIDESYYFRNFSINNVEAFKVAMSAVDWTNLHAEVRSSDADTCFNVFYERLLTIFESIFPLVEKKHKNQNNNKKNKWFTPELGNISKMLHEMHQIKSRIDLPFYNVRYRELKLYYRKQIKIAKKTFNDNRIKSSKNINKESWSIIKEANGGIGKKHKISQILLNDQSITEGSAICEAFSEYYAGFANNSDPPRSRDTTNVPMREGSFFLYPTSPDEVEKVINKMCKKKSSGTDDIPGTVCIAVKHLIAPILSQLINLSFLQGIYPSALKNSKITPLFKNKGNTSEVENYRPVALQCQIAKVFESCFNKRLTQFLENNSILSRYQNGFREGHSTNTALDYALQHIYDCLNNRESVLGLFWDMSRAFDTVDHGRLTKKMFNMGIRGPANCWIKSYLSDRTHQVVIDGVKSSPQIVKRGIPQGSCVSPTLFNCYINDLPNETLQNTYFVLYADDTNVIVTGKQRTELSTNYKLGTDHINSWCTDNGIQLNKKKIRGYGDCTKKQIDRVKSFA